MIFFFTSSFVYLVFVTWRYIHLNIKCHFSKRKMQKKKWKKWKKTVSNENPILSHWHTLTWYDMIYTYINLWHKTNLNLSLIADTSYTKSKRQVGIQYAYMYMKSEKKKNSQRKEENIVWEIETINDSERWQQNEKQKRKMKNSMWSREYIYFTTYYHTSCMRRHIYAMPHAYEMLHCVCYWLNSRIQWKLLKRMKITKNTQKIK